jgi:hypothetical protein
MHPVVVATLVAVEEVVMALVTAQEDRVTLVHCQGPNRCASFQENWPHSIAVLEVVRPQLHRRGEDGEQC